MVSGSARYRPTLRDSAGTRPIDPDLTGLFFDLDGVLWDTSALHEKAFATVCADEGLSALPYALLAGRATPSAWTLVLAHNGRTPDPDLVARLSTAKQVLARRWLSDDPPLSAELGIVAALPPSGVVRGLVTGSSSATTSIFLAASGLSFDVVITGESVEVGKPGPAPYLAASSAVGLEPGRCWVLEDSDQGLASAAAAGARAVHFSAAGASCDGHHVATEGCVASIDAFVRLTGVVVAA
jgi:beta-phosphoglucomutase-like phosphatase (HAD superfamily)